jgi:phage tail sheath gpL-like
MCKCPGEQSPVTVTVGTPFEGCDNIIPPTDEEVVAQVNVTAFAASLVNGVMELLGVVVVDIEGNSFTLNITATVPIDGITEHLKQAIADYFQGEYTADDITIDYVTKRAHSGVVQVTVNGHASAGIHVTFSYLLLLASLLVAVMF